MANEQGLARCGNLGSLPRIVVWRCAANGGADASLLEKNVNEGESPVVVCSPPAYGMPSQSHVPWKWSAKWVVNFISS